MSIDERQTNIHKHKEHGEDISHENEIVIDFKLAQTDDTISKLRNNVRDLLSMNHNTKQNLQIK